MMAECMELAKCLHIDDAIVFHGSQSTERVAELLSKASLFVQHSIRVPDGQTEALGITPLEASASEVPVVATKSGGIIETIVDGETGLLVAEHDVDGMADAMIALLENRPLAEAMGHAGRARVKELFTLDRTAARLREIMGMPC
jgi:glycosyltransferase involved in cell wall biosynthesis